MTDVVWRDVDEANARIEALKRYYKTPYLALKWRDMTRTGGGLQYYAHTPKDNNGRAWLVHVVTRDPGSLTSSDITRIELLAALRYRL